jgi:hypothetical protein
MIRKFIIGALAAAGFVAASSVAQAVTLSTLNGPLDTGTSFSTSFNKPAGQATLVFDLLGYASLDGVNCCTDVFTLALNGTTILEGSYNLGGGGLNVTNTNLGSFTFAGLDNDPNNITFAGGAITINGLLNLMAGSNTLTFSYSPGFQGLGDEGWGVANASVSAVPLPPAVFLLATGVAGLASLRRKKKKLQA